MMLNIPGICCEYSALSLSIIHFANHRAILSCIGCEEEKLALYSHPSALELSVYARIFCGVVVLVMVRSIVMAAATNSRTLMESRPMISFGSGSRHAIPFVLYPPMPCSQASENVVTVGVVKVILLILTPLVETESSILSQR